MANKIAVVTGGAGGIGQAVVTRLAESGFSTYIIDLNEQAGQELVQRLRQQQLPAVFYRVDLTAAAEIKILFERIHAETQRIDVLVNLAGGTLYKHSITKFPLSEWRQVIDVNLKATFLCCQAVCKRMREAGSGVIINTSSNFALTGSAGRTAYSAAKAAVIGFTKSLALELAPHGVRVNALAPGLTATPRVKGVYSDDEWRSLSAAMPLGRAADPVEIAEGVNFLASDDSAFMTGQVLHVNGGMIFN